MKINILVDNDKCWNLNIVKRLIPYLKKKKIIIDYIWILPNKLGNLSDNKISIWYFKTFGTIVFLKLSIFIIELTFPLFLSILDASELIDIPIKDIDKNSMNLFIYITSIW